MSAPALTPPAHAEPSPPPLPVDEFCSWVQRGRIMNAFPWGVGDPSKWDRDGHWSEKGFSREPLFTADQMHAYVMADRAQRPAAPDAVMQQAVAHPVIAGALFDFMGFLPTSEERWMFSAYDDASPAVEALEQWAATRGLFLDDANVSGWNKAAPGTSQQSAAAPGEAT